MTIRPTLKLLMATICLAALAACSGMSQNNKVAPVRNPREILMKALQATIKAKSYHLKLTALSGSGSAKITYLNNVAYVQPDRYQMAGEVHAGSKGGKVEFVVVGNEAYSRKNNETWQKVAVKDTGISELNEKEEKLIENLSQAPDSAVELVGTELLNGRHTTVLRYSSDYNGEEGRGTSSTKVWVGDDGWLYQSEIEATITLSNKPLTVTTKMSKIYSDYNTEILIELPNLRQ